MVALRETRTYWDSPGGCAKTEHDAQQAARRQFVGRIAEQYEGYMFTVAFWHTGGNRYNAQDVVQNVLLKMLTTDSSLQHPQYEKTWLTRIVINAAAEYRRKLQKIEEKHRRYGEMYVQGNTAPSAEQVVFERIDRKARVRIVQAGVETNQVVQGRVLGMSYSEIAAQTGKEVGAVKSTMHKWRQSARQAFQEA